MHIFHAIFLWENWSIPKSFDCCNTIKLKDWKTAWLGCIAKQVSLRNTSDSKNQFTNSIEFYWRLLTADKFSNSKEEARQYTILSLASFPWEFCTIPVVPRLCRPVWSTIVDLEEVGRFLISNGGSKTNLEPLSLFFQLVFSVNKTKTSML